MGCQPAFTPEIRSELAARCALLSATPRALVVDGDMHLTDLARMSPEADALLRENGPAYYHGRPLSAEDALAEMAMSGVDVALVWQNPAATERGPDPRRNYEALLEANRHILEVARRFPDRFIPAGWTDPGGLGLDGALALVDRCVCEFGFLVIKLNPAQNRYPIDSAEVLAVVDRILSHGAIPAFHVGGDTPFTPASGLARVARHCGDRRLIAVHMGGGGAGYVEGEELYRQIRALGLAQPNLFFVQSAKRDCHIESDFIAYQEAGLPFCRNIAVGSDAPYGRLSWNFGGYRAMFRSLQDPRHPDPRLRANPGLFDETAVEGYLGGNMARLLADGFAAWLG